MVRGYHIPCGYNELPDELFASYWHLNTRNLVINLETLIQSMIHLFQAFCLCWFQSCAFAGPCTCLYTLASTFTVKAFQGDSRRQKRGDKKVAEGKERGDADM